LKLSNVSALDQDPFKDKMLASIENLKTSLERAPAQAGARLGDVAAFLSSNLADVEALIRTAASLGEAPGTGAAAHLQAAGGKRIRPMLVLLAAAAVGEITDQTRALASVAELVHMATLLHDDVLDDASERRGVPVARRVFGNAVSVLGGDLLLVNSLERAHKASPEVFPSLLETLRRLVDGEIVQLRGRTVLDTTLATYERIVTDKTASLFAWAARAGAQTGGNTDLAVSDALSAYGHHVGIAFQVIDDLLDYAGDHKAVGKSLFADLIEGKITLPLVYAIEKDPGLGQLVNEVRNGDDTKVSTVAARVHELDVFEQVRVYARNETSAALSALDLLPNSAPKNFLKAVAQDLAARVA
jgi:octaprenyl-diphosphate synthase